MGSKSMSEEIDAYTQPKPRFDPTINYGHVLAAVSFIVAGAGAYYGMRAELQNVDQRVAKLESTLQQLANVVVLTARQDEKLNAIKRRVDRIEQGAAVKHP
jgi:hypothetical protein